MFLYLGIIAFIVVRGSNGQDSCLTTWNTQGTCININECEVLLQLLKKPRPLSSVDLDTLKRSQCGFEGSIPKVCCPPPKPKITTTEAPVDPSTMMETPVPDVTNHPNIRLLDNNLCGPLTQEKIFGGNKTKVLEFPWMALIAYQGSQVNRAGPDFRCGGSVIAKKWVLTAAHCVTGLDSGLRVSGVRIGEHNLSTERDCDYEDGLEVVCAEKYQDFLVANTYAHEGYQKEKLRNDIALIKLDGEADFRPQNVRPICLPIGPATKLASKKVIVAGWGRTEETVRSQDLLKAKLPIVLNDQCTRFYKDYKVEIWYKQICAGGANRVDSCSGDSGGPMLAPAVDANGQPKYFQYGVVSFGPKNCGIEGFPGVYTRVTYYMDWILDKMSN